MDIKFLDKIVDQIVSETTVDYKRDRIYSPFTSPSFISHISYRASTSFSRYFIKHCKEVYGLKDKSEINYVWYDYVKFINKKVEVVRGINESIGGDKKFLDKVVNSIVDETEVEYGNAAINFPFFPNNNPSLFGYHNLLTQFIPFGKFYNHCRDIYGLKDEEEIDYVWGEYKSIIIGKVTTKENLNESIGGDKKFLNKVVNTIVGETTIDYVEEEINFPSYTYSRRLFQSTFSLPDFIDTPPYFAQHLKEVYGLKDSHEIDYVWGECRLIVNNKIRNTKESINEFN